MNKNKSISPKGQPNIPFSVKDFPVGIREILECVDDERWRARYLLASFPCIASYAERVRAKYAFSDEIHTPLFDVVVVGYPASGKSFIRKLADQVMAPIEKADDEERRTLQAYRDVVTPKKKGDIDKPLTCIRCLTASTSQAAIQKYAADTYQRYGDYLPFFYLSEEATMLARSNKTDWCNMQEIMRLGFDFGSKFGNDRAHADCSSIKVEVRMNMLLSTTFTGVDKLFTPSQIEQGTVSRFIPIFLEEEIGALPPRIRSMKEEKKEKLSSMLLALREKTFKSENELQNECWIDMSWLFRDVEKWCEAHRQRAIELESRSYESFYRRASVIGFRGAMLFYYLYLVESELFPQSPRTKKWIRKKVRALYFWLSDYVVGENYLRWGEKLDNIICRVESPVKASNSILAQLPAEFSREELDLKMKLSGSKTDPKVRISQWKAKGLILETSKFYYQKTLKA